MKRAEQTIPKKTNGPLCYLQDLDHSTRAVNLAFQEMKKKFRKEGLKYTYVRVNGNNQKDIRLRDTDIHISADVVEYDRGDPFVRISRPWISNLLGLGAFKIALKGKIRLGTRGEKAIVVKASRTRNRKGSRQPTDCLDACLKAIQAQFSRQVLEFVTEA